MKKAYEQKKGELAGRSSTPLKAARTAAKRATYKKHSGPASKHIKTSSDGAMSIDTRQFKGTPMKFLGFKKR